MAVKDNQVVERGELLLKINPEPFQLDLDRLQAELELAQANAEKAKEEVVITSDRIASQQAQLDDAKVAFERAAELRKLGNIAQNKLWTTHGGPTTSLWHCWKRPVPRESPPLGKSRCNRLRSKGLPQPLPGLDTISTAPSLSRRSPDALLL